MKKSISVYVVTHKDCFMPENPLLKPIQVGCALNGMYIPNMLYDDDGDNISAKNRMYCELTAQYWAWKNDTTSDYIGFFHYRRYLNFSGRELDADCWGNVIYNNPLTQNVLNELGIEADNMEKFISQYDVIVPKPRVIPDGKDIYDEYVNAEGQHKRDLDTAFEILTKKYPEYVESAKEYMKSKVPYEVNMFIMKSNLFKEYASWLFDILFEVEKQLDFSDYNQYELRVMGFLSERLFGIWFTHNKKKKTLRTLELQKTLFRNTDKPLEKIKTQKNAVVSVLACNDNYVPYFAVMLQSIVQNAKQNRPYEIYLLTTDVSLDNQNKLKQIVAGDSRFLFRCINVQNYCQNQNFFVHTHISVETYYRFFIFDLFKDTQKVLYLDSDMVVNADIAELYDTELGDNYLAAAKDIDLAGSIKHNKKQSEYVKNDIGCSGADEYFQAGVLLFNLETMKNHADMQKLVLVSQERNWNYMDQDILNHVYQKKIVYLNQTWNCVMDWREPNASRMEILKEAPFSLYNEYLEARKSPKIVHYAGYQKPWNKSSCDFSEYFWKYARQTVFYEELIVRLSEYHTKKIIEKDAINPRIDNIGLRVSEIESWNLKSRFPRNTLIWRGCRKILWKLKKWHMIK